MNLLNICFQGLKGLYLEDSPETENAMDKDIALPTMFF